MSDIILSRRGLILEEFYERQHSLHESTLLELNEEMDDFNLGLEVVLVGVDQDSKAHIY